MRSILSATATLAFALVALPANAAHVVDRGELAIDIDAPGSTVCHFSDTGPVDATGCTAGERAIFSNLKAVEPNAFAALVVHYPAWQTSITVTRTAALHSMTQVHLAEDLAAYAQGMRDKIAGTQMQIVEAPRLVRANNNVQVIVSALRNASTAIVTRSLEVRALHATYRVLFSVADAHAADIAALADRAAKTIVARPALTFAEEQSLHP